VGYQFDWSIVLAGEYRDWLIEGFILTLKISGLAGVCALVLGTILAVLRLSRVKPLEWFSLAFTEFFRNTPLLVQLFFWYFGSETVLPRAVNEWLYAHDFEFAAGTLALTVYSAAFIAEELRAGVFSIPKTQFEASRATGLSFLQSFWHIILPQAFRIAIPPLVSQLLNLFKNSSLVMTIGVMELTYEARQVESFTFHGFEAFTAATLMYLAVSLCVSLAISMYSRHFLRQLKH